MKLSLRRQLSNITSVLVSPVINWLDNINFSISISANTSFSFLNALDGNTVVLRVINTSGSNLTLTWPVESVGASTSISANKTRLFTFIKIGTTIYSSSVEY